MRLASLQQSVGQLENDLDTAARRLRAAFPKYDELATPPPIGATTAQRLLRDDEALVSVFTLSDRALVWVLRPGRGLVYRDIGEAR